MFGFSLVDVVKVIEVRQLTSRWRFELKVVLEFSMTLLSSMRSLLEIKLEYLDYINIINGKF